MDLKDLIGSMLTQGQAEEVTKTDGINMDIMDLIKKGLGNTEYDLNVADANKVEDVQVVKEGETVGNLSDIIKDILADGKIEMDEVISAVKTVMSGSAESAQAEAAKATIEAKKEDVSALNADDLSPMKDIVSSMLGKNVSNDMLGKALEMLLKK